MHTASQANGSARGSTAVRMHGGRHRLCCVLAYGSHRGSPWRRGLFGTGDQNLGVSDEGTLDVVGTGKGYDYDIIADSHPGLKAG